jgi:hypothetical protein
MSPALGMTNRWVAAGESRLRLRMRIFCVGCVALLLAVGVSPARAQQASSPPTPPPRITHRFWDRTNDLWFAGVGAARGLDYASTLNLRRRGINEVFLTNSIVDNHALFGGIEAAATGASIGVSYLFHRTGHHRLERWTSIVHFGVATVGAARNYALKTPHPAG